MQQDVGSQPKCVRLAADLAEQLCPEILVHNTVIIARFFGRLYADHLGYKFREMAEVGYTIMKLPVANWTRETYS